MSTLQTTPTWIYPGYTWLVNYPLIYHDKPYHSMPPLMAQSTQWTSQNTVANYNNSKPSWPECILILRFCIIICSWFNMLYPIQIVSSIQSCLLASETILNHIRPTQIISNSVEYPFLSGSILFTLGLAPHCSALSSSPPKPGGEERQLTNFTNTAPENQRGFGGFHEILWDWVMS